MVSDVEETSRGEETGVPEVGKRGFDVERPLSGKANEGFITNNPFVRRSAGSRGSVRRR
jgi:hypothetical protein